MKQPSRPKKLAQLVASSQSLPAAALLAMSRMEKLGKVICPLREGVNTILLYQLCLPTIHQPQKRRPPVRSIQTAPSLRGTSGSLWSFVCRQKGNPRSRARLHS
ncbi:Receptor-Type Tyrosine-Protein Phosphatase Delta [Manis pentadactyla]|nr:Receptor-Type Tyrosine-Protein Phosphatase Delta [Manis pentadactyla]